ncbi:MAG TPA: proteasome accessory factor PafA2 family protein [Nitrospiraceae bacterium]|nr:proteasome accessory factor PafA2 family protein [Nitrospiraceae bacterium]
MRLFGIETEYGITREDQDTVDPVVESMELVRAHLTASFERRWDYGGEDPHEDARGFRVSGLQQDKEEDEFAKVDAHRPFSFHEMKSDLILSNGARFYNDHTHPEYSTPECRSLLDILAHDRAGECIVRRAAERRNQALGGPHVQLYKNNTDFHGHSYGCHDNYLVSRSIPFSSLTAGLLPFLVSRQIIAGAGKVGVEGQESGFVPGRYQLSQRADFIETDLSVDTMHNRPILNTRDEPHAIRERYRRLHLIIGDANMCEYSTALKVGTTQLVLELIARGAAPVLELEHPVAAVKQLSRDQNLKATVRQKNGNVLTGLNIQEQYYLAAEKHLAGTDAETDWILAEWSATLRLLAGDRQQLVGRLDWVTKLWLLETFMQEERIEWDDPWLTSLDLEYHNIDPNRGLFLGIEADGKAWRMTSEQEVESAAVVGPVDTRAGVRGLCIRRFPDQIKSMQWERIQFSGGLLQRTLEMGDLFEPEMVQACARIFEQAVSPMEALTAWNREKELRP